MTDKGAIFDRRAAVAAVVVCPLGAGFAVLVEGAVVMFHAMMARVDNNMGLLVAAIMGIIVTLAITAIDLCVVLPLAVYYPLSRSPTMTKVVFPVFGLSSSLSAVASGVLLWLGANPWPAVFVPYCYFVVPATSAAIMCFATYRWLARRHPDE